MTMRTNCILLLVILLGAFPLSVHADESGSIILYTPYTKISVTPGASIDYSIDLINNTDGVTNANLSVSGLPGSWKHEIKSGGWTLSQLSVLPQERNVQFESGSSSKVIKEVIISQYLPEKPNCRWRWSWPRKELTRPSSLPTSPICRAIPSPPLPSMPL